MTQQLDFRNALRDMFPIIVPTTTAMLTENCISGSSAKTQVAAGAALAVMGIAGAAFCTYGDEETSSLVSNLLSKSAVVTGTTAVCSTDLSPEVKAIVGSVALLTTVLLNQQRISSKSLRNKQTSPVLPVGLTMAAGTSALVLAGTDSESLKKVVKASEIILSLAALLSTVYWSLNQDELSLKRTSQDITWGTHLVTDFKSIRLQGQPEEVTILKVFTSSSGWPLPYISDLGLKHSLLWLNKSMNKVAPLPLDSNTREALTGITRLVLSNCIFPFRDLGREAREKALRAAEKIPSQGQGALKDEQSPLAKDFPGVVFDVSALKSLTGVGRIGLLSPSALSLITLSLFLVHELGHAIAFNMCSVPSDLICFPGGAGTLPLGGAELTPRQQIF